MAPDIKPVQSPTKLELSVTMKIKDMLKLGIHDAPDDSCFYVGSWWSGKKVQV